MTRFRFVMLFLFCLAACGGEMPASNLTNTPTATTRATTTPTQPPATIPIPTDTPRPSRTPAPTIPATATPRPRPAAIPLPASRLGFGQLGTTLWVHNLPDVISRAPAVAADGHVYVVAGLSLYALTPDGREEWHTALSAGTDPVRRRAGAPVVAPDGRILVIAGDTLQTFAADGTPGWRWSGGDALTALPAFSPDGGVYVMTNAGNLWAFDPNGRVRWTTRLCAVSGTGSWPGPAVGADGVIYAACRDPHVFAIDPTGGDIRWAFAADEARGTGTDIVTTPLMGSDGTIYAANDAGTLFALHPDGQLRWSLLLARGIVAQSSLTRGPDNTVYLAVANRLYLVTAEGTIRRVFDLGVQQLSGLYGQDSPVAVAVDGSLIAKSTDQELLRFSTAGEVLWRARLTEQAGIEPSPPAVGTNHQLYIGLGPQLRAIQMDDVMMEGEALLLTAAAVGDAVRLPIMPASTLTPLNDQLAAYRAYEGARALQWSPDGALLAVAGTSGVRLFAVDAGSRPILLNQNVETTALAFDATAAYLAAVAADGVVRIWDVAGVKRVAALPRESPLGEAAGLTFLEGDDPALYLALFAPAADGPMGYLYLYDVTDMAQPAVSAAYSFTADSFTRSFAAAADGRRVALGDFLADVQVCTLPYGPWFETVFAPFGPPSALALSDAGHYLAAGTLAGRVQVVHVDSGFMVADIRPPADVTYVNVQAVLFRRNLDEIIFGESFRDEADEADQGRVAWWSLPRNVLLGARYADTAITHLALHPAGWFLAVATEKGLVVTDLAEWDDNE